MRRAILLAILVAALGGGGIVAMDQHRRHVAYNAPLPLTVPAALPLCADLDFDAAEYDFAAAAARISGYWRDEELWAALAGELRAKPCVGPRWEREE